MGKMSSGMRMMAMARAQGNQGNYNRMGDGGQMMGNQMTMGNAPEMRRQRDSRGRYMEGNVGYHMPPYLERPMDNYTRRMTEAPDGQNPYGGKPEVYRQQEERRSDGEMRRMTGDKTSGGEIDYIRPDGGYGNVSYFMHKTDPMNQHDGKEHMMGHQRQIGFQSNQEGGLDKETVMSWVENMEDDAGVRGGKYSWHQAQQHAIKAGITGQEKVLEFFWALNAMYADYHKVAKKFGVDRDDFYACLAKAFLEDPDAVEDKVAMYQRYIVKK